MTKKKTLHFLLLAFAWTWIGCAHKDNLNNVFVYNESNGISTLDPAYARDLEIMWATNQLFDGLVELDDSLHIVPALCKSYSISEDQLRYTFTIRTDVYFHDSPCFSNGKGRLCNAHDFKFSFERILDPNTASPGKWIFDQVSQDGIQVLNDTTLEIRLKKPFAPFLGLLTTQYANVVPQEAIAFYGKDFARHPVGTGPFQFAFWYEDVALVFHKNQQYYLFDEQGMRLPYLDAIKIEFVKDMTAEYLGLMQGRYDFMSGVTTAFKDELLDANGNLLPAPQSQIQLQKTPFIKTDYLGIVCDPMLQKNLALLNPKVRQALHLAIDKKKMVKYLRNNTVIAAENGFCSPAVGNGINSVTRYSFQLEKAKQLLANAGYPNAVGIPKIELATTSDYADLMEFIQHEWQKLGINCEVTVVQKGTFSESTSKCQISIFRKSWLADHTHPENFYALFSTNYFTPNGPNYTHFSSIKYDSLYTELSQKNQPQELEHISNQLEEIIANETPVIPLYYDQVMHFVSKKISQFPTNSVNMLDLRRVRKN